MTKTIENTKHLELLRNALVELNLTYTAWKSLVWSRCIDITNFEVANVYTESRNCYGGFFHIVEHALQKSFVTLAVGIFDGDTRTNSVRVFPVEQESFLSKNKTVFEKFKYARDKLYSHRDVDAITETASYSLAELTEIDEFIENIKEFYNKLTGEHLDSSTYFDLSANAVIGDVDNLLIDAYFGYSSRKVVVYKKLLAHKEVEKMDSNISTISKIIDPENKTTSRIYKALSK